MPLRVLHVESSLNWGGQEARIVSECRWLRDHGHAAFIACDPQSEIRRHAENAGVALLAVPMTRRWSFSTMAALLGFARRNRIDVVNSHSSKDAWLCLPLHLAGYHVARWRNVTGPIGRSWRKTFIYRHGNRHIIATAEVIRQALREQGVPPEKVDVIGEGIDLKECNPSISGAAFREELGLPSGAILVGAIAMMRSEKGLKIFAEAAFEAAAGCPQARFVIVGGAIRSNRKSRLESELEGMIREKYGASVSPLTLAGYRAQTAPVMAAMDIVAVPSLSEARSRVLAEAMAMHKAVVASRVGGMPEVVAHEKNGLLVPPGDAAALADALKRLIVDESLRQRLAAAALETARRELSIDRVMEATIQVYRRRARTGSFKVS